VEKSQGKTLVSIYLSDETLGSLPHPKIMAKISGIKGLA